MRRLTVFNLGLTEYQKAWELQRRLLGERASGKIGDHLLLLEHPSVYTIGRRGKEEDVLLSRQDLARMGVPVHHVDRGGEVTYHGPGQLVAYPIIDLRAWGGGPLDYVCALESVIVSVLGEYGIIASKIEGLTGVWVGGRKIASIGVRVSRGVTMHGFALNVAPDLTFFGHIVPCGIRDKGVTSMAQELGRRLSVNEVALVVARRLGLAFGMDTIEGEVGDIAGCVDMEIGLDVSGKSAPGEAVNVGL